MGMVSRAVLCALLSVGFVAATAFAGQAIPEDQCDKTKVYWGNPADFDNAAEVDLKAAVKATPEYKQLLKKNVKRGTAKYWELMSRATDRAIQAVMDVAGETDFDLICAAGYLGGCDPPMACTNITKLVIEKVEDS